jgi:putative two-component system response regulator
MGDMQIRRVQKLGAVGTGMVTSSKRGQDVKTRPRILVVDDDYFFVDLVEDTLRDESDVIYASNGAMALEIASQTQPDIILLDVMMPEIHGYEVCRRLKAHHETTSIPVIFLTSLGEPSSQKIGLGLGAVDYIAKPFDPNELKNLIRCQMERKSALGRQRSWRRSGADLVDLIRFWWRDPLL